MSSKSEPNPIIQKQLRLLLQYSERFCSFTHEMIAGDQANVAKALRLGLRELKNRNPEKAKILLRNVFVETGLNEQEFLDHLNITEIMLG